ncbi:MAG: DMT family transporter [Planctomycetes bacterium]|nr:DMT family transporter [Planctomycetota bacterium]
MTSPAIYIKLVLTAIFWGGTFIAGRQVAQDLGPFSIAFLRFAMASVLLLSLTRIQEGRFPRVSPGQLVLVVLLGLTGVFAYNALFFKGLSLIEASRASLIVATCPAFIAIASVLFLHERLALVQAIGIPLSILGAAVVIAKGDLRRIATGGVGLGELYILGCVLNWAAYSLLGKVALRRLSPLVSVSYSSLAGAIALAFPALYEGLARTVHRASWLDWTSMAYLAVCGTVIGFVWFYEGVQRIGATRAGLFINFVPISAVILAFFMLREPITWSLALGAALVLSGVYLTNRVARPREPAACRN